MMVTCDFCKKEFEKYKWEVKRTIHNFCSQECYKKHLFKKSQEPKKKYSQEIIKKMFLGRIEIIDENTWMWKGSVVNNGYGRVMINKKSFSAHRLSYTLFVGDIPNGMCVCHKDDIRLNVSPKNLFIGTYNDNIQDMVKKKRQARGSELNTKLTENDVSKIIKMYKSGSYKQKQLATIFHSSKSAIGYIVNRQSWKHVED